MPLPWDVGVVKRSAVMQGQLLVPPVLHMAHKSVLLKCLWPKRDSYDRDALRPLFNLLKPLSLARPIRI
jgi:hypothetical protein